MIVPTQSALAVEKSVVSLARYAKIINIDENSFWGVRTDDIIEYQCYEILLKWQRDLIARTLYEAQIEIEDEVDYLMQPTFVVGIITDEPTNDQRLVDEQWNAKSISLTKWKNVIQPGVKKTNTLELGSTINTATDPGVVQITPAGLYDLDTIEVYHPDSNIQIQPSRIYESAGDIFIEIPRCRTVKEEYADNNASGVDYSVLANFLSTVDVYWFEVDDSVHATLKWAHQCNSACKAAGCAQYSETACIVVEDHRLGILKLASASYTDGAWVTESCCYSGTPIAQLNYYAGLTNLNQQAEDTIVRLAHSKMSDEACGCDVFKRLWRRDTNIPDIMSKERLNCPFGLSDGAWIAWQFTQSMAIGRSSVL